MSFVNVTPGEAGCCANADVQSAPRINRVNVARFMSTSNLISRGAPPPLGNALHGEAWPQAPLEQPSCGTQPEYLRTGPRPRWVPEYPKSAREERDARHRRRPRPAPQVGVDVGEILLRQNLHRIR